MARIRTLFAIPALYGGGAERVVINLLKKLDRQRFELHLALVSADGRLINEIPEDVTVHNLSIDRVRWAILPLSRLIKKIKPHVTFSTLGHLNLAVIFIKKTFMLDTKVIVREANTVSERLKDGVRFSGLLSLLYKTLYPRADKVICQSDYMLEDLSRSFGIPKDKMIRIYNPVDFSGITSKATNAQNPFVGKGPHIVAAGRLCNQKGMDRLIKAFSSIAKENPGATLWVLGEGPMESSLKELCYNLNLTEKINFPGYVDNPYAWLANADLFVLPSRYEGLPNVLLEAIVCGRPVAVTEHPGGTREIMKLTGQEDRVFSDLQWDKRLFEKPAAEVAESLKTHFSEEETVGRYADVIEAVSGIGRSTEN